MAFTDDALAFIAVERSDTFALAVDADRYVTPVPRARRIAENIGVVNCPRLFDAIAVVVERRAERPFPLLAVKNPTLDTDLDTAIRNPCAVGVDLAVVAQTAVVVVTQLVGGL